MASKHTSIVLIEDLNESLAEKLTLIKQACLNMEWEIVNHTTNKSAPLLSIRNKAGNLVGGITVNPAGVLTLHKSAPHGKHILSTYDAHVLMANLSFLIK